MIETAPVESPPSPPELSLPEDIQETPLSLGAALASRFVGSLERALAEAGGHASGTAAERAEAVRQIRKATKRCRALLPMIGAAAPPESLSGAQRMLSDVSSLLSPVRDRDAMLATIERLLASRDESRVGQARATLAAAVLPAGVDARSRDLEDLLVHRGSGTLARLAVAAEVFRFDLVAADGVVDVMGEAWRAARRVARSEWANGDIEASHALRKHCARLAMQLSFFNGDEPKLLRGMRKSLRSVTKSLGDEHDLAMLAERISLERSRFASEHFVTTAVELCNRARRRMREKAALSMAPALALRTKRFRRALDRFLRCPEPAEQESECREP